MWGSDRSRNIYNSQPSRDLVITYCGGATSGESSGSEFVEEEKPWPPDEKSCRPSRSLLRHVPRVPRPHSHLFRTSGGRARGSKHSRRWENCEHYSGEVTEDFDKTISSMNVAMFLSSLHDIPEEEYEAAATILPLHDSPFSRLHNSDKYMQVGNCIRMWLDTCRDGSVFFFVVRFGAVLRHTLKKSRRR